MQDLHRDPGRRRAFIAPEKGASLSSTPEMDEPQLAAARAKAWHQDGNPLLTAEAARDWLGNFGLVLFASRPLQLPSPAPSFVEAMLGAATAGPTTEQIESAKAMAGRLVADGTALPLNLMGMTGETPDFLVSAQVFSYIFTLRGDKAWKQPPSTSGAVKVSPLGLKAFEVLTEHGSLTAAQLASEMGREASEAATLRVLTELWSQLRVLPLLQPGDAPAVWELTTRRFTKAIKAGANAGQPTALSALISLYLAQAFAATEEEITTFLSPLTARSRLREVLHALTGARQLETLAVEGKTLLHIPGSLAEFTGAAPEMVAMGEAAAEEAGDDAATPAAVKFERPKKVGTGRINSFKSERKPAAEFRGKPVRSFPAGAKPARSFGAGARPARGVAKPASRFAAKDARFAPRADGKSDRERRPFRKDAAPGKPNFAKPWDEEKKARPARSSSTPDSFRKFRKPEPEDRKPLGAREQAGLPPEKRTAPRASFDRGSKPGGFAKRPFPSRSSEGTERGSFKPHSFERGTGERGAKPGGFGAKPFGSKPFGAKPGGFGAKRPYTPRPAGDAARGPYKPRVSEGGERASFKPRSFERVAKPTGFGGKPAGFAAKRPFTPRPVEGRPAEDGGRSLPKRPYKPRAADADKRIYTKAPWVPKTETGEAGGAKRPFKPGGKFGGKSGAKFGAKKFGAGPSGPPAARGFGGKSGGPAKGARPYPRKRPEAEA